MDDHVIAAARVIRPYLVELVGPATAPDLDRRIAELLDQAGQGTDSSAELSTLLQANPTTRVFTEAVIRDAPHFRPPSQQPRQLRSYSPVPGMPQRISAREYKCPDCGSSWFRPSVRIPVPQCQTDHVRLIPVVQDAPT